MSQTVRTRFAPSPTGHLHIGNARTAILNWIIARHAGGQFILRVEDTDQERSTQESEASILKDLQWLGLDWDEGPDTGGNAGPYRQSERMDLYKSHLDQLIESEKVYPCYCTAEELEERRSEQLAKGEATQYNGHCRNLSYVDKQKYEAEGREPAFRFKADTESVTFEDLIRGAVTVPGDQLGDFIIARAGGMPMYNFACVIDDHLMEITQVVRGDDHVSNTPRQILIYQAFGWTPPQFAHIPMILGPDRQRLSKRHGATSVDQYREQGYLSDALVNFLSLLSWSSESGDEILTRERLISEFNFSRLSKSAAVFDTEKLDWMNGMYIRNLDVAELSRLLFPILKDRGYSIDSAKELEPITGLIQEKIERLSDANEKVAVFFKEDVNLNDPEARDVLSLSTSKQVFQSFLDVTDELSELNRETFMPLMKAVQQSSGIKGKELWMPVRVALTGQLHGPDLAGTVEWFGLEKCRKRVTQALEFSK
ncbi:glutamate--tRNA ligase [candidate division KSB1 bacterium]|nr:glutamate--tRNA ligase [candidate division KSB1 bacterium]